MTTAGRFGRNLPPNPASAARPTSGRPRGQHPHRRPDQVEYRIIGAPAEVRRQLSRLVHLVDIAHQSPEIPSKQDPGDIVVYVYVDKGE